MPSSSMILVHAFALSAGGYQSPDTSVPFFQKNHVHLIQKTMGGKIKSTVLYTFTLSARRYHPAVTGVPAFFGCA